jgi:malonyl CoA-acyl carrier protein transacylase
MSAKKLPVACAFHSPVVAGASDAFAKVLDRHEIGAPDRPVFANRSAVAYEADRVPAELAAQLGAPVRFVDQIEAMYAAGARVFLEAGPGQVLSGLVDAILGDRPHTTITCESKAGSGLRGFLAAVAQLAVAGVDLRTGWLTSGRDAVDVSRATPPAKARWTVDGQLVRTADGKYLPGGLAPARRREVAMTEQSVPSGQSGRDAIVSEFLRTSRELVAAQRDVMLTFLGTAPVAASPVAPVPVVAPLPAVSEPVVAQPVPVLAPAAPVEPLPMVVELIAERTGYPAEMIEPDLDLEADLSVDSIKRTEIAGELAARLGLDGTDGRFDDLVRMRTTRAMADWITAVTAGSSTARVGATESVVADVKGEAPQRFLLRLVDADAPARTDAAVLAGKRIVLSGGRLEIIEAVSARLTAAGVQVTTAGGRAEIADPLDGLVFLDPLSGADEPVLPTAFPVFRSALHHAPRWLFAVAPTTEGRPQPRVAGLRGMVRSIAMEYPDTVTRLLELDFATSADTIATAILDELLVVAAQPVVVRSGVRRQVFAMAPVELGALAVTGAGPAGDAAAEVAAMGLDRTSVVLLVGGARGITARLAGALAMASRCTIELVGRTVLGAEPEHPAIAGALDLPALRAALVGRGYDGPAAIDKAAKEILARREVAATLRELRGYGSEVNYRSVDVRDAQSVGQLVKQVHAEHGRIDGVVYAAGVIEDKLVADKDERSFGRVFGTKVDGATALLGELAELPGEPAFVVLFGSIAAALGNRGQVDYAAANDALETLGAQWAVRTGGRALTVHWGPWAPSAEHGGMVGPELARAYAGRGIALIDPVDGVASLLRELAWGEPYLRSVVLNAATRWDSARRR